MSALLRPKKESSHQALKARATRERILQAMVRLINESGFGSATSSAIAKEAGITWGAVQHHFGNKEEILLAVLQLSREEYLRALNEADLNFGSLEDRIDCFIETVWNHYKSDLYFAFTEIVMATRGQHSNLSLAAVRMSGELQGYLWKFNEIFKDFKVSSAGLTDALRFAHRFLAGLALDRILEPECPFEQIHLQRIKSELFSMISSSAT